VSAADASVDTWSVAVVVAEAGPSQRELRERACASGDRETCIAAFTRDCNAATEPEYDDACTELVYRFVVSATPSLPEARRFALRCIADRRLCPARAACERNEAAGCVEYGDRESAFGPALRDFRIITAAYRKACTLGSAAGCRLLAHLYESGPEGVSDAIEANVPFDKKEARRLYQKACTAGDKEACDRLAQ
jgi:hypothetical protein